MKATSLLYHAAFSSFSKDYWNLKQTGIASGVALFCSVSVRQKRSETGEMIKKTQTGLKRITWSTDSEGQSCSYLGTSEQNRKAS